MLLNQGLYALKPEGSPRHVIWAFRGEYAFLSNFEKCQVSLPAENGLPGMAFNTVEKAYMAWKTLDQGQREIIQESSSIQAKVRAHEKNFPLRPDYADEGRLAIMLVLTRQKYSLQNPDLRDQLMATDNALLIEGNDWGDVFFGFSFDKGHGANHLGRILMQVRDEMMPV